MDVIQYDAAVVREIVYQLQAELAYRINSINTELLIAGDTGLSFDDIGDNAIEAREEDNLGSRMLPQHNAGVWVRVVDSEDLDDGPNLGEGRAIHTVEVHTWVNVQDSQPDSTTGSASSGYTQALYLARAVDDTICAHVPKQCRAGISLLYPLPGNRIPTPLKRFPSVHVILLTYEVTQRTLQPQA